MTTGAGPLDVPIRIRVDYDFASSLCYVAHRAMERLASSLDALGLALDWSPLDLSRITGWRRGAPVDDERLANVARVARELDVPLRIPPVWLDSRRAHAIGLLLPPDREATWRERIFCAVFEEGHGLDDPEIDSLTAGLGIAFSEAEIERGRDALEARTRSAHEEMVTGVPSFMLGEWPFGGIQTDDTMLSILGRFARKQRGEHTH